MFTVVTLLAAGTFVALVVRRLKLDIAQEKEFRSKLTSVRGQMLQQS